jgi:uncharacterized protein (TIGR03118 family)
MSRFLCHAATAALALSMMQGVAIGQEYTQTNLVANIAGVAPITDPDLVNPWGMSRSSGSPWWISDNLTGVSTLYSGPGTKEALTVTIPAATTGLKGTPTGTIYNGSKTDFLLAAGTPALFLFATLDGQIVGWNSAAGAKAMVKNTDGSAYTGLTSIKVDGRLYLLAANFTKGRVDVFDNAFRPVNVAAGLLTDSQLPANYVPFNVQAIGSVVVVTYVLHEPGNQFETDGPGMGRVDVYSDEGRLLIRLQNGVWLNSPWGVALAPTDFGAYSHDLLIAQWGGGGTSQSSGYIAAYDLSGSFKGVLEDAAGNPLAINGIWDISFGNFSLNNYDGAGSPSPELYFTAGPVHGAGGLLGYLTAIPADQIQGNDQ